MTFKVKITEDEHMKQIIYRELTEKQGENHQKNASTRVENNEFATVGVHRKQTNSESQYRPEEGQKRLPERMPFLKRPCKKCISFRETLIFLLITKIKKQIKS